MLFCFFYVVASNYFWLSGLTICFNFGVLELHVCLTVLFGLLDVAVLNVLAGAGVFCVVSHSQQTK
jgi:hypothetical protein